MRRVVVLLVVVALAGGAAAWWVKFQRDPPGVVFAEAPDVVGPRGRWVLEARAGTPSGLRRVEVRLVAGGRAYQLHVEEMPATTWLGSGVEAREISVDADLAAFPVEEGPAELSVFVETWAWHVLPPARGPVAERPVTVDLTAPRVRVVTRQHNVRLGGSAVAVLRVGDDAEVAEVVVGDYRFPAHRGAAPDPELAVAIFAVPEDLTPAAAVHARVVDGVGNERRVRVPCAIRDRRFQVRQLAIGDRFLERKVPELFALHHLPEPDTLLDGYLYLNRTMRAESEAQIAAITASSHPRPLWDGAFQRQPRAAATSAFADRRVYVYEDREVDRQTHLGFDLASVRQAPVEAAQHGVVAFTGDLGIYGDTVVLDHGLGVFSLYAHLSGIVVAAGDAVAPGDVVGYTGETGLAGGDHLHFSIMVHGTHVDPVEWWDPQWMRDHVTDKLQRFAVAPAAPGAVAN